MCIIFATQDSNVRVNWQEKIKTLKKKRLNGEM